jgi:hypothetical protein
VPNGPEFRTLQSRLALPVSILVATHLVGILGYHALWHDRGGTWMDALFMTFTTVATIGYGEVKPLDDAGRIFTMVIATAGIGTLFYTFSVGLDHLTSDSVRQSRRRRRSRAGGRTRAAAGGRPGGGGRPGDRGGAPGGRGRLPGPRG